MDKRVKRRRVGMVLGSNGAYLAKGRVLIRAAQNGQWIKAGLSRLPSFLKRKTG